MISDKLLQELNNLPNSRLVSKDLLPTTKKDRHISPLEFMLMWVGMSILLAVRIILKTIGVVLSPKGARYPFPSSRQEKGIPEKTVCLFCFLGTF